MSIINELCDLTGSKLVIPYAGKMFNSSISSTNMALCLVLNKGYIQTEDLEDMLYIVGLFDDYKTIVLVGGIEKIVKARTDDIVYRQRVFFKSLSDILRLCKKHCIEVEVPYSFKINISNTINCIEDLPYLEHYAAKHKQGIDLWLTNACLIHLNSLCKSIGVKTNIENRVEKILEGRNGYLDNAPFLVCSYNIDLKKSAIFIDKNEEVDKRIYSGKVIGSKNKIILGYTKERVIVDRKNGVFR